WIIKTHGLAGVIDFHDGAFKKIGAERAVVSAAKIQAKIRPRNSGERHERNVHADHAKHGSRRRREPEHGKARGIDGRTRSRSVEEESGRAPLVDAHRKKHEIADKFGGNFGGIPAVIEL